MTNESKKQMIDELVEMLVSEVAHGTLLKNIKARMLNSYNMTEKSADSLLALVSFRAKEELNISAR